jgi:bifunctional DNA-binding transcriptional regulator/antitoxin component of YhaV-PrlF toxin-antitoxin module
LGKQAQITSKGRITVLLAVHKALGVRAGDVLLFEEDKTGVSASGKSKESVCQVPGNRLREESDHSLDASDARTMTTSVDTNVIVAL